MEIFCPSPRESSLPWAGMSNPGPNIKELMPTFLCKNRVGSHLKNPHFQYPGAHLRASFAFEMGWDERRGREGGTIILGKTSSVSWNFPGFVASPIFLWPMIPAPGYLLHPAAGPTPPSSSTSQGVFHITPATLLNKNTFIEYRFGFIMKIENIIFFHFQKGIYPLIYKKPLFMANKNTKYS